MPSSYSRNIVRWFVIAFAVLVLTVLGGVFLTESLPKIYTATAEIQINPAVEEADIRTMNSDDLLLPIINDLKLDQIWAKRLRMVNGEKMAPQDALAHLRKMLRIELKRGTNIVMISASCEVATEAADIANAVADRYQTLPQLQEYHRLATSADAQVRDQIEQQQKVVDGKKAALDKWRQNAASRGIDVTAGLNQEGPHAEPEERQKDLQAAKEDYEARRVVLQKIKDLPDDEFINTMMALGHQEPSIAALRKEILSREQDLNYLLKDDFGLKQPQVGALRAEIEQKKQQMKDLVAGERRTLQVDCAMAKSRVDLLQKEMDALKMKLQQSSDPRVREVEAYREAALDLDEQQSILDALQMRLRQANTDKRLLESPIRIISRADAPRHASSPNKRLCLAMAVVVGVVLGPLVATMVEIGFWVLRRRNVARRSTATEGKGRLN